MAKPSAVPVAALLEPDVPYPGDTSVSRGARLSAAIRAVMWPEVVVAYASPVERPERDEISAGSPADFFADMPAIDARRG